MYKNYKKDVKDIVCQLWNQNMLEELVFFKFQVVIQKHICKCMMISFQKCFKSI
jgi:hypothetical protein